MSLDTGEVDYREVDAKLGLCIRVKTGQNASIPVTLCPMISV